MIFDIFISQGINANRPQGQNNERKPMAQTDKKPTDYKIAYGNDLYLLENNVKNLINAGWEIHGNLVPYIDGGDPDPRTRNYFAREMVKYGEASE